MTGILVIAADGEGLFGETATTTGVGVAPLRLTIDDVSARTATGRTAVRNRAKIKIRLRIRRFTDCNTSIHSAELFASMLSSKTVAQTAQGLI